MTFEDAAGGLDLGALLSQLGQVQNSLHEAQVSAASQVVVGSSGGGAVRVTLTGGFEFQSVTIKPEVVDASDVEMLEDLVLSAIRDGLERANDLQQEVLGGSDPSAALGGLLGALAQDGADFGQDDSDFEQDDPALGHGGSHLGQDQVLGHGGSDEPSDS